MLIMHLDLFILLLLLTCLFFFIFIICKLTSMTWSTFYVICFKLLTLKNIGNKARWTKETPLVAHLDNGDMLTCFHKLSHLTTQISVLLY